MYNFVISAQSFGLPFLSPYLNSLGPNFTQGANFATAASTIKIPNSIIPNGMFSPFYLRIQYIQFRDFIPRTKFIRDQGKFNIFFIDFLFSLISFGDFEFY